MEFTVEVFAIAGGAGPGGEDMCVCCGFFPILPVILILAFLSIRRKSVLIPQIAILITGLPLALSLFAVSNYRPSDDGDVMADQTQGWNAVMFYGVVTVLSVLILNVVIGLRLKDRNKPKIDQTAKPTNTRP